MSVSGTGGPKEVMATAYADLRAITTGGYLCPEDEIWNVCEKLFMGLVSTAPVAASILATGIQDSDPAVQKTAQTVADLAKEILAKLDKGNNLDDWPSGLEAKVKELHAEFEKTQPMTPEDLQSKIQRTGAAAKDIAANKAVLLEFYTRNSVPLENSFKGYEDMAQAAANQIEWLGIGRRGEVKLAENYYLTIVDSPKEVTSKELPALDGRDSPSSVTSGGVSSSVSKTGLFSISEFSRTYSDKNLIVMLQAISHALGEIKDDDSQYSSEDADQFRDIGNVSEQMSFNGEGGSGGWVSASASASSGEDFRVGASGSANFRYEFARTDEDVQEEDSSASTPLNSTHNGSGSSSSSSQHLMQEEKPSVSTAQRLPKDSEQDEGASSAVVNEGQ